MAAVDSRKAVRKFKPERRVGRAIVNPLVAGLNKVGIRSSSVVELETTGAKSGQPRQVPLTGHADDSGLWVISQHGRRAGWAHNITANPKVRVRVNNEWRSGTAVFVADDDVVARARSFGGKNMLTVCRRATTRDRLVSRVASCSAVPSRPGSPR